MGHRIGANVKYQIFRWLFQRWVDVVVHVSEICSGKGFYMDVLLLLFRSFKGFTYLIIESPTMTTLTECPIWLDCFIFSELIALGFVFDLILYRRSFDLILYRRCFLAFLPLSFCERFNFLACSKN